MNHSILGATPARTWSATDLKNKWTRKLPEVVARSLPWDVLNQLVQGLSDDTLLPRERLAVIIQSRDVSGLFEIATAFDVTEYTSPDLLIQDRLVVDTFSKYEFPDSPFNKRERAQLRFAEAEVLCREANRRIVRTQGTDDVQLNAVIHKSIRKIEQVLGKFNLDEMLGYSRFGPGATLCVGGPYTTQYFKLCEMQPTVSYDALPYAEALMKFDPYWHAYLLGMAMSDFAGPFSTLPGVGVGFKTVSYNKVTFVPKNAKTERSIAIEPYFNIFFQLGIGAMIRRRLFAVGINLDSQELNQLKALAGSIDGLLATIDFSMASDTISKECVRLLLPPEWFDHLERLRSKTYVMSGAKPVQYEKFSTMGNGYTFELETLIFYAVAFASSEVLDVDPSDLTVYGDDVVLDARVCDLFIRVCSYLGFKINEEKSFRQGNFRESCGKDYLKGVSVRPVFCKELGTTQHVASFANRLSELNRSVGFGSRINGMLDCVVDLLHAAIPADVRRLIVGPPSENVDGYIHTTDTARLAGSDLVRWNHRLFAWEYPVMRFVPTRFERRNDAIALCMNRQLASPRRAIPVRQSETSDALRRFSRRHPRVVETELGRMHFRVDDSLKSFYDESTPFEITGRKIGKFTLGKALFWDFPR